MKVVLVSGKYRKESRLSRAKEIPDRGRAVKVCGKYGLIAPRGDTRDSLPFAFDFKKIYFLSSSILRKKLKESIQTD